ncbi:hypothetical protein [Cohnella sp. GbtcB17]|uniref:hypothetical protein n=1 Tax=Cohnella sp. GbtcB17 TaxID=2824762 RepID=UPI001C2FC7E9|nr:hypothetical protein [Cohnella sp. GbtcB17]
MDITKYVNRSVEMIYEDQKGNFTQRPVKVIAVNDNTVSAYDLTKHAPRSLHVDRILACRPLPAQGRGIS